MTEETPTKNIFKKGVDGQKTKKKMEFWKGRKKENQERKQKRKKRSIFKTGLLGEQNRQNTSKIAGNSLFGPFYKTQAQKHRQQKTKPPKSKKNIPKKYLFAFWQTTPIFGKFLFFFFQVTFFHVYKAVFCWKHYKISVFSRAQLLCITDSKTPFRGKTQNGTFVTKSAILGFPRACWNPYFCSVWWLWLGTKKRTTFPKQIVATKMRTFLTFRTQIVLANFSKKWHFYKKGPFVHNHPKNTIFLGCFWNVCFPFFHVFSFSFSNLKKTKTKSAHFFSKTLFWQPDKLPKNYFHAPTLFVFLRYPKNTIKLGKPAKTNLGPSFDATLDQVLTQKPKSWTKFWLYSIYIYMCVCCEVIRGAKFGLFKGYQGGQV